LSLYFYETKDKVSHLKLGYRLLESPVIYLMVDSFDMPEYGQWAKLSMEFSDLGRPFQFVIQGELWAESGELSIDDIIVSPRCEVYANASTTAAPVSTTTAMGSTSMRPSSNCTDDQFKCAVGDKCVSQAQVCNFVCDCEVGDCSDEKNCGPCEFDDEDWCGWKDVSKGKVKFHWEPEAGQRTVLQGQHQGFITAVFSDNVSTK
jgi:hypothetical protein